MAQTGNPDSLVVVGVDGSEHAKEALRWAAAYGLATGAPVRAILCWHYHTAALEAPVEKAPAPVTDKIRQEMSQTLATAVADAAVKVDVEQVIGYGHPAQVLVEQSAEAGLLVVGSRGRSAVTGLLLGSVSLHCVTNARCPVVVVRDRR